MKQFVTNFSTTDYLTLALTEAKARRGFCAPNPAVGAVVVKDGEILALGKHWQAGKAHAEVEALSQLTQEQSRDATLYVTLEPCCHFGRTPPCTDLIIKREIAEVFYAYADPNSMVSGKGRAALIEAGISCEHSPLSEVDEFYRSYQYWHNHGRPWVSAKLALSLDGKIASADGSPVQITGAECLRLTHENRYTSDAILTTATTILADNPALNVRLSETFAKPVYILDRHLRLSGLEKVFSTAASVTIFYGQNASQKKLEDLTKNGVRSFRVDETEEGLDLPTVLDIVGQDGMHDLWVEAGGKLFYQLYQQELIHRALIYLAPKTLGEEAKAAFPASFDVRKSAVSTKMFNCGEDVVWELIIGA